MMYTCIHTGKSLKGKYVVKPLLTKPFSEYGSSRYGKRAIIPCAYITFTLRGGEVLVYSITNIVR